MRLFAPHYGRIHTYNRGVPEVMSYTPCVQKHMSHPPAVQYNRQTKRYLQFFKNTAALLQSATSGEVPTYLTNVLVLVRVMVKHLLEMTSGHPEEQLLAYGVPFLSCVFNPTLASLSTQWR